MSVELSIPTLGNRFVDYRMDILGDSYDWGPVINAREIRYLAFHHSVTPQTAKNDGNWKAECDRIASEHVNGNGWGGVGYRFIIASNGIVAYVGDLSHGGSAVEKHNDTIFSVCMIGDFTKELPTDAQIHSAHDLADWFLNHMPQYPNLSTWDNSIIGHKDAAIIYNDPSLSTACPGTSWPNDMKERIKNNIPYTPAPTPVPPPTPAPDPCQAVKAQNEILTIDNGKKQAQIIDLSNQLSQSQVAVSTLQARINMLNTFLDQITVVLKSNDWPWNKTSRISNILKLRV